MKQSYQCVRYFLVSNSVDMMVWLQVFQIYDVHADVNMYAVHLHTLPLAL